MCVKFSALTALSPLDGRYQSKLTELRPIASEYGLIYYRFIVEIRWLMTLADLPAFTRLPPLSADSRLFLTDLIAHFDLSAAEDIKKIEQTTNHDVKAIEYYIQNICESNENLVKLIPFIHFGCTSEDINNLAYGLMLSDIRAQVLSPAMGKIIDQLTVLAQENAQLPMLARTHGQPASPTTLGKELANVVARLTRQWGAWRQLPILGKFNGAIGNFNAHFAADHETDWPTVSRNFISELGLTPNLYTTQIEPHDNLAELLQGLMRFNTILIDLNRDIWGYISLGYFGQKKVEHEIGSSTMPHKINPIDFENSEGNLGMANALAGHLAEKLPVSRWQRDLSDSTVLRNLGVIAGYSLISYQTALAGLQKLTVNAAQIQHDLVQHWEVLAEAVQSVLRRYGVTDAYERLKSLTRGKAIDQKVLYTFIEGLPLPSDVKKQLQALTPADYTGYAALLARQACIK
jgi:adenylosuccinate lyase